MSLSCAHVPLVPRKTGTIQGVVLSNADFKPVEGAGITLDRSRRPVTSGTDGKFQFAGVAVGEHRVSVRRAAYSDAEVLRVPVTDDSATCILILPQPYGRPASDVLIGPNVMLIVDGVIRLPLQPVPGPPGGAVQVRNPLQTILVAMPINNIASHEVLNSAGAAQLYGQRAARGAIHVTTRAHAPCATGTATPRARAP